MWLYLANLFHFKDLKVLHPVINLRRTQKAGFYKKNKRSRARFVVTGAGIGKNSTECPHLI